MQMSDAVADAGSTNSKSPARAVFEIAFGCADAPCSADGKYCDSLTQARWEGFQAARVTDGLDEGRHSIQWQVLSMRQYWINTSEMVARRVIDSGHPEHVRALGLIPLPEAEQRSDLCPDPGPWQIDVYRDGRIAIQSHAGDDAALEITGNFTDETRRAYADNLCAWLNRHPAVHAL